MIMDYEYECITTTTLAMNDRMWDLRSPTRPTMVLPQSDDVLCCSLGLESNLVAAGLGLPDAKPGMITGRDRVVFLDVKKGGRVLGEYTDVHTDLINKVRSEEEEKGGGGMLP